MVNIWSKLTYRFVVGALLVLRLRISSIILVLEEINL